MTDTTRDQESDAQVRPRTIPIGTDARGQDYYLKTETDPDRVVVVHGGERVLVDQLHELTARDVARTVAREIGWDDCRFAEIGAKAVPRRYA
jgi:hypothetical protein